MESRAATSEDLQAIAVTLVGAFAHDPVWSWAFPERDQLEVWWRFWVAMAIPQGAVRMTEHAEAVTVWIPPGGYELAPVDEPHVAPLLRALIGERAHLILELLDCFEANHPPASPPYYFLTAFGTAPEHRGHGVGMALLTETLGRIDAEHAPAYLESSNPVNIPRYESVGFVARDTFELPEDNGTVTTMWRDPR
jgi:GNAT superfamily N-acetyltransferase